MFPIEDNNNMLMSVFYSLGGRHQMLNGRMKTVSISHQKPKWKELISLCGNAIKRAGSSGRWHGGKQSPRLSPGVVVVSMGTGQAASMDVGVLACVRVREANANKLRWRLHPGICPHFEEVTSVSEEEITVCMYLCALER